MNRQDHFIFNIERRMGTEFYVTIPANVAYYATCSLYDEQNGPNINYEVEIDIEDDTIVNVDERINYFLFANGDVGPKRTALILRTGADRTIKISVAKWPEKDKYDSCVNRTNQIAPPDDSYINFTFVQDNSQHPAIWRAVNLDIIFVYS